MIKIIKETQKKFQFSHIAFVKKWETERRRKEEGGKEGPIVYNSVINKTIFSILGV